MLRRSVPRSQRSLAKSGGLKLVTSSPMKPETYLALSRHDAKQIHEKSEEMKHMLTTNKEPLYRILYCQQQEMIHDMQSTSTSQCTPC